MTPEELDSAISELIVPVEKPKYKTNSYFKKRNEYRRIKKYISYILHESRICSHYEQVSLFLCTADYGTYYRYFPGTGITYKVETNQFRKVSYNYIDKDKRLSKLRKKINIRASRRYLGIIPNGSAYKRCSMRINKNNYFLNEWYD